MRAVRGRLLSFIDDPAAAGERSYRYLADGVAVLDDGKIAAIGDSGPLLAALPAGTPIDHYPDDLVLPGLIDTHLHYPQTQVIGSYGAQLLDWLQKYTFVEEQRFAEPGHAQRVAAFFMDELFRNGTTTAMVYCTSAPASVDAFFAESSRRHARMIAGKVMMDRGAPEPLLDTAELGYRQSLELAQRWHGKGRQLYAVTPRFAVTSTAAQLEAAAQLLADIPGAYLQSHLAENKREIATVAELFPQARSYTDIYDRFGLLGPRSVYGHCIHLGEDEVARLAETGSVAAHCPTSNLFIGSGLFDLGRLKHAGVRIGLATDIGGGTSYSMLRTAAESYKVLQLQGQNLQALNAFYMMTLGNARALQLDDRIGALDPGHEADLVVLDARATPAMAHRMETIDGDLAQELFVLMTMGDDRSVRTTYVAGAAAHRRKPDLGG